ncbi:protein GAMETE EXPRESSED 2 isoform X2 [Phoenix dactylifera]|uniref:Protein GAMETE EXPRESSED 2 isoform X2 n=1 Tax=Phoenix dactylifera TaxID=42345 RepID=A0A8B9ABB0_PHODC|nr:protein GAMETE EXPRESSED 2 isoform X2 [Phoenix dactylifera]
MLLQESRILNPFVFFPDFDDMSRWIKISSSILCLFIWILSSDSSLAEESSSPTGAGGKPPLPSFAFGWLDDKNTFQAGEIATIKIKLLDYSFGDKSSNFSSYPMNFSLSVSGKKGNSSYVSGVFSYLEGDPTFWNISFIPIWIGEFTALITEDYLGISDSTLHFSVTAGHTYPSACVASWGNLSNEFVAGTKAYLFVLQKDAFGNSISSGNDGPNKDYFMLSASYENGSTVNVLDVRDNGWDDAGYVGLEFVPTITGSFLLHVYADNRTLSGSPLPFMVKPGPLDIAKSVGKWKYGTNYLQIFSKLEIFIHQQDLFGNLVPGFFPFDARVVQKATNLSIPVADLFFQEVAQGIQLLSFIVSEPGEFVLTIFDSKLNTSISNMTYDFTVFIGYCHRSHGFANGSGLAGSRAGILADFTVYLEDMYHNPSPIEAEKLHVQILSKNGTFNVRPVILPLRNTSEHGPVAGQTFFVSRPAGSHPALPANEDWTVKIIGKPTTRASEFNVSYTPKVSGEYEIWVFCGNIPLNNGHPYLMKVSPGEYFSEVCNDSISVWEDESVAFDVLLNDYVAGGIASIIESSTPFHGSLLQYGRQFRYTPYKGFYGNDSFSYTISDINNNVATGTAFISVLCKPPQFVSVPDRLHVTEDVISPKFGGFPGFEIMYSDMKENISVTIRAQFGTVFLAPMPMQLHQPLENILSVCKGGRAGKDLILAGHVEILNYALQLIQYLGNDNFYGHDIINLYAMNKNGIQDAHVPVFVEPVNDPPIINAPKFIFLGKKEATNGLQIFDKQRDLFEFSISDSDIFNFPGNKSHFVYTFSLEVNDGILSTSLPVNLIDTAELKTTSSNQWEPLQTFVTISNHFVLKGKGVRFCGTMGNCNNAMQHLFYQGGNHDDILTVTVNDMGNYGCYPDCTEMMSSPLYSEVTVNLIRRRPVNSMTALLLRSAIIIEIIMMLLLGGVLLLFICKCMKALYRKRSDCVDDVRTTKEDNIDHQTMNVASSQNATCFEGRSSPFSLKSQHLTFRQRSHRGYESEESGKDELSSSQSIDGGRQPIPLHIERQKLG